MVNSHGMGDSKCRAVYMYVFRIGLSLSLQDLILPTEGWPGWVELGS